MHELQALREKYEMQIVMSAKLPYRYSLPKKRKSWDCCGGIARYVLLPRKIGKYLYSQRLIKGGETE